MQRKLIVDCSGKMTEHDANFITSYKLDNLLYMPVAKQIKNTNLIWSMSLGNRVLQ